MTKLLTLLTLAALLAAPAAAQGARTVILDAKEDLWAAVNTGDVDAMLRARAAFERATAAGDDRLAGLAHYYAALAGVRASYMLDQGEEKDRVLALTDAAIEHLDAAVERYPNLPEAHALLSSAYGMKIGLKPMTAMFLGPRSGRAMDRAKRLDADNPRVVMTEAQSLLFTPKIWGGSKARALEGFERAAGLFRAERVEDPLMPGWGRDENYAWMGMALQQFDRPEDAHHAFKQALVINPENEWVSRFLLPDLERTMSASADG